MLRWLVHDAAAVVFFILCMCGLDFCRATNDAAWTPYGESDNYQCIGGAKVSYFNNGNYCCAGTQPKDEEVPSDYCEDCAAGKYQPLEISLECTLNFCSVDNPADGCTAELCAINMLRTRCRDCGAGTYNNFIGTEEAEYNPYAPIARNTKCYRCPAGYHQPSTGMTVCEPCPVGTFQQFEGQAHCDVCPAGTYQNELNATLPLTESCKPCAPGTFSQGNAMECGQCAAGSVQSEDGSASCEACPGGTYADSAGLSCTLCDAGTFSQGSAMECEQCAPGSVQSAEGATFCQECSGGTYMPDSGGQECLSCEEYLPNASAAAYQPDEGSTSCSVCPEGKFCPLPFHAAYECGNPGFYCPEGSQNPTQATVGFYTTPLLDDNAAKRTGQAICEAGYKCQGGERLECLEGDFCPPKTHIPDQIKAGHYFADSGNNEVMLEDATKQVPCPAGSFCAGGALNACINGKFCPEESPAERDCAQGFYCSTPSDEFPCKLGEYCPSRTTTPAVCAGGSFCPTPASQLLCGKGSFCHENSTYPQSLRNGRHAVNDHGEYVDVGGVNETDCPVGHYCSAGDKVECTEAGELCPIGSSLPVQCPASSYCPDAATEYKCPAGSYCPQGSVEPMVCAKDFYCPLFSALPTALTRGYFAVDADGNHVVWGGAAESDCTPGFFCSDGNKTSCEDGQYCPSGSHEPAQCPAGWFCSNPGTKEACSPGSHCPEGSTKSSDCEAGSYCATPASKVLCLQGSRCPARSSLPTALSPGYRAVNKFTEFVVEGGVDEELCPAGWYCESGNMTKCTGLGDFCPSGSSNSARCPAGFYCSTPAMKEPCSVPDDACGGLYDFSLNTFSGSYGQSNEKPASYCPEGSTEPLACEAGSFCVSPETQSDCPAASFCVCGSELPNALNNGYYAVDASGNETNTRAVSQLPCLAGSYCKTGADHGKNECEPTFYCPAESSFPVACTAGHFCRTPSQQEPCEPGYYCPEGTVEPLECIEGATCLIPGAPELVILPDALVEIRESDIANEQFNYTLSLSYEPFGPVTVNIKLGMNTRSHKRCNTLAPESRLILETTALVFSPEAFSIPQTVHVTIPRDENFTGPTEVFFTHSVTLPDENKEVGWRAPFLRPMSLTLVDNDPCTEGAQKVSDQEAGIDVCACSIGHYIVASDSNFCGSVTACNACRDGMVCDETYPGGGYPQRNLSEVVIQVGWFRQSDLTENVVECTKPKLCIGGKGALCAEHHTGPLCMVCATETVWSGGQCVPCDTGKSSIVYGIFTAMALLLIWVAYRVFKAVDKKMKENKVQEQLSDGRWAEFVDSAQTKYKIGVRFLQTLSKIVVTYPISLPGNFTKFIQRLTQVFVFIDVNVLPFNCVVETNFHDRLLITTVTPIVFVAFVLTLYAIQICRLYFAGNMNKKGQLQAKCVYMVVIFAFTIFPIVSSTILQTFAYDHRFGEGQAYLKADYSITRDDEEHQQYVSYALVCMFFYCLGIPSISLLALYLNKVDIKKLQTNEEQRCGLEAQFLDGEALVQRETAMCLLEEKQLRMKAANPFLIGLSVLYKDYEARFWWFEVLQFCTTLFLCGLSTTLPAEDASQVFISLLVSLVQLGVCANCHPYMYEHDDFLAQACEVALTFTLSVGLLGMASTEYQDVTFGPLLIGFTTFNMVAGFSLLGSEFVRIVFPDHSLILINKARRFVGLDDAAPSSVAVVPILVDSTKFVSSSGSRGGFFSRNHGHGRSAERSSLMRTGSSVTEPSVDTSPVQVIESETRSTSPVHRASSL